MHCILLWRAGSVILCHLLLNINIEDLIPRTSKMKLVTTPHSYHSTSSEVEGAKITVFRSEVSLKKLVRNALIFCLKRNVIVRYQIRTRVQIFCNIYENTNIIIASTHLIRHFGGNVSFNPQTLNLFTSCNLFFLYFMYVYSFNLLLKCITTNYEF